jgi:hypothetical protein
VDCRTYTPWLFDAARMFVIMKTEKATNVIQVFKTDVLEQEHADMLCELVQSELIVQRANFDLQDCDRILRVESIVKIDEKVIALLSLHGFTCEELPE